MNPAPPAMSTFTKHPSDHLRRPFERNGPPVTEPGAAPSVDPVQRTEMNTSASWKNGVQCDSRKYCQVGSPVRLVVWLACAWSAARFAARWPAVDTAIGRGPGNSWRAAHPMSPSCVGGRTLTNHGACIHVPTGYAMMSQSRDRK